MKKPALIITLVVLVLIAVGLIIGFGRIEDAAKEGAKEAVDERLDNAIDGVFQADGVADEGAQAYSEHIKFELKASRTSDDTVTVGGLVRNNGSKKVTFLKVLIVLLDGDGVVVGERTDLLAHNLPIGDNNSPVLPGTAKRVTSPISNSDWKDGKVKASIVKIAIK